MARRRHRPRQGQPDKHGTYLVKLGTKKLLPEDSREVGMFLHTIGDLERIGDHCSNIAATLIQTKHNSFDMHSYLTSVKGGSGRDADAQFITHVDAFSKRFKLPDPAQFETKEQK